MGIIPSVRGMVCIPGTVYHGIRPAEHGMFSEYVETYPGMMAYGQQLRSQNFWRVTMEYD